MLTWDEAYDAGTNDGLGFIQYGPTAIRDQIEEVNRFLSVVNEDMVRETTKQELPQMRMKWNNDVWVPWQKFYRAASSLISADQFRDSTYTRAEAFRQLGLRYRENLEKKVDTGTQVTAVNIPPPITKEMPKGGIKPTVPSGPGPGISLPSRNMGGGIPWGWIAAGGAIVVGGYLAYKYWPRPHLLSAPSEQVSNPPPWVHDVDIWESAKLAVEPYKGRYDNPDAVITHVYKQMGGRIG